MANKNQVYIDIIIDDKGTTKRIAVNAKKLGIELDKSAAATERGAKGTDKLSKSNRNLDRNMRGTAKMSGNQTKEFSKMQQGMGGLVAVYATLAAQVFAVSAAFQFLQSASNIRNLIAGQEALGAVTGTAYKTITSSIIAATDAQINYSDAAKAAAIGTAAGLSAGQLEKLGTVAKHASFALGRDLTDSFNRLVRGVTKAEPELLDELGIILRLDTATAKYAESIGVNVNSLTAFQRSQAVANEVLEQGTRKFGAIEAMMTKDAAALAQFTKSFDDLFNTFKTGIINLLGPILQFLSKNTLALTASLALFAIPIVKAIIPNLDTWREKQNKLFMDHQHEAAIYLDKSMEQSKALEQLTDNETKLAAANKKTAEAQKKKTDKGGVGYVSGGAGSPQARAAAKKGLKLAQEDLIKHTQVQRGIFKGYTADEVRMAQMSYNKRTQMAETHTQFVLRKWKQISIGAKIMSASVRASWATMMGSMVALTQAGAAAMQKAMSMAGWIGIIVMMAQLGKQGWDWLHPQSEEAKKAGETLDELSEKYKDLGAEMERAAHARKNFTTGSMDATNIGQVMQSADIPGLVDDLNEMAAMEDKTSEKFKNLYDKLNPVLWQLTKINPEFSRLHHAMHFGLPIQEELKKSLKGIAEGYVEVGSTISNLPELLSKANASFTSLTKSLVKSNPLDQFLTDEKAAIAGLEMDRTAKEEKIGVSKIALDDAKKYEVEQGKIDKRMLAGLKGTHSEAMKLHWAQADEEEKAEIRKGGFNLWGGAAGWRGLGKGIRTDPVQQLDKTEMDAAELELERKHAKNIELENEADAILETRKKRAKVFIKLRSEQLALTRKRMVLEKKSIQNTVLGVTLEGKLHNIAQKRLAGSKAINKAEDMLAIARKVKETESSNLSTLEKQNNADMVTAAEEQLELAQEQEKLNERKRKQKEEDLRLEIAILGVTLDIARNNKSIAASKGTIKSEEAMGGGTWASQGIIHKEQRKILALNVVNAKNAAEAAAKTYDVTYARIKEELETTRTTSAGHSGLLSTQESLDIALAAEARAHLEVGTDAAAQKVADTNTEWEAHKGIAATKVKSLEHTLEEAELGLELVNVADHLLETERQIAIWKLTNVDYTQAQIDEMRRLANQTKKVNEAKDDFETMKDSIYQGFEGAFESLITGAKNAKEAFADMAKSILQAMAQIMARKMAMAAMDMIGMPMARGGITPSYASGGYALNKHNYSRGGPARGAQSGYAAILHGNEAVVPLPDNRHIPVDIQGGAGQQNNVTINVSMDNSGNKSDSNSDSRMGENLGRVISQTVQEELQYQKRSGGILNPYGVA